MNAAALLPTVASLERALGEGVTLEAVAGTGPGDSIGEIVRVAARDSAYRQFRGSVASGPEQSPLAVSALALVFDNEAAAARTFGSVAQAAHLHTEVGDAEVAVETTTAPNGVVSYWAYVHRGAVMLLLTLDTIRAERISIAELRNLVLVAAERIDEMAHREP